MALENVVTVGATYEDSRGVTRSFPTVTAKFTSTLANRKPYSVVQTVGFAVEEALLLGDLAGTEIKALIIRNLDPTNYVQLRQATGAAAFARLPPDTNQDGTNIPAVIPWDAGTTAPFVIANTAICQIEIYGVPL